MGKHHLVWNHSTGLIPDFFFSCIRIWQNKTYVDENYHIVSITFFEWSPPTDILPDIYSGSLSGILSEILSDMFSRILSGILFDIFIWHIFWHFYQGFYLTFYVTSCTRDWGPTLPIEIWLSQLRSGSAHWALELAIEGGVRGGR